MQSARTNYRIGRNARNARVGRWWLWVVAPLLVIGSLFTLAVISPPTVAVSIGDDLLGEGLSQVEAEGRIREFYRNLAAQQVRIRAGEISESFTREALGLKVDVEAQVQRLRAEVERAPWYASIPGIGVHIALPLTMTWEEGLFEQAIADLRAANLRTAVAAHMEIVNDIPVITPEVVGSSLSVQAALSSLQAAGLSTEVVLPVEQILPEVTAAGLADLGIRRVIAEWTTEYDPTIPRAENVERAALAFHGLMIGPGETLSYNETVGPITSETGWREAFVIVGGKLVPGIGGGVCQVATTLYGAALRANLQILERHPHHLAVSYIAPSQDAAIAQGWEDLQIRNTSGGHLLIHTEASGGKVTFKLYGDMAEGIEVKIESQVLGSQPFLTEYVVDEGLRPGQEVVQQWGIAGIVSEAYRVVYENGELISRELLSRDRYLPTTQIVLQGPKPQPVAAAEPASGGVAAGDSPEPIAPVGDGPPVEAEPEPGSNDG